MEPVSYRRPSSAKRLHHHTASESISLSERGGVIDIQVEITARIGRRLTLQCARCMSRRALRTNTSAGWPHRVSHASPTGGVVPMPWTGGIECRRGLSRRLCVSAGDEGSRPGSSRWDQPALLVECGAQTAQSVAYPGFRGPERDVE